MEPQSLDQLVTGCRTLRELPPLAASAGGNQGVGSLLRRALNLPRHKPPRAPASRIGVHVKGTTGTAELTLFTAHPDRSSGWTARKLLAAYGTHPDEDEDEDGLGADAVDGADDPPDRVAPEHLWGRRNFSTITSEDSNWGFDVDEETRRLRILTPDGDVYGTHSVDDLFGWIERQLAYLLVGHARRVTVDGREYFDFHAADLYHGGDPDLILDAALRGEVTIAFRLNYDEEAGAVNNRGMRWATDLDDLPNYYEGRVRVTDPDADAALDAVPEPPGVGMSLASYGGGADAGEFRLFAAEDDLPETPPSAPDLSRALGRADRRAGAGGG